MQQHIHMLTRAVDLDARARLPMATHGIHWKSPGKLNCANLKQHDMLGSAALLHLHRMQNYLPTAGSLLPLGCNLCTTEPCMG